MTLLQMAASYRRSAQLLRQRMTELKEAAGTAPPEEKFKLEQRARELNVLYRETRATALLLERYYDRRDHRHDKRAR